MTKKMKIKMNTKKIFKICDIGFMQLVTNTIKIH